MTSFLDFDLYKNDGFYSVETALAEIVEQQGGLSPTEGQYSQAATNAKLHNVCILSGYLGSINFYWFCSYGATLPYIGHLPTLLSFAAGCYQINTAFWRGHYNLGDPHLIVGVVRGWLTQFSLGGAYLPGDLLRNLQRRYQAPAPEPQHSIV